MPQAGSNLSRKDRAIVAMLVFYIAVAVTLELYWILFRTQMLQRHDPLAWLLSIYWPADRSYRDPTLDHAQAFVLVLESVNTLFSTWLNLLLIHAIIKGKRYRHTLQLTLSTYTAYGTFLYYAVTQVNGFAVMNPQDLKSFLLFYVVNAPWLAGYGYMIYDSIRAIHRQMEVVS